MHPTPQLLSSFLEGETNPERSNFVWELLETSVVDNEEKPEWKRLVALLIVEKLCSKEIACQEMSSVHLASPPRHVLLALDAYMRDVLSHLIELLKVSKQGYHHTRVHAAAVVSCAVLECLHCWHMISCLPIVSYASARLSVDCNSCTHVSSALSD